MAIPRGLVHYIASPTNERLDLMPMSHFSRNPESVLGYQYVEGTDTPTTLNALMVHGCTSLNGSFVSPDPDAFQYGDGDGNDLSHIYWTYDADFQPWQLLNDGDWVTYDYPVQGASWSSFMGVVDNTTWTTFYTAI